MDSSTKRAVWGRTRQGGRRRAAITAASALCAAVALAACSSSSSSSSSSSGAATSGGSTTGSSSGQAVGVSLILKTLSNPYFVTMQKDAQAAAAKDNVHLTVAAGKQDGDTQTQITAIDNAISRGDKGILITTNGNAVNAALNQAKQAGLFVIALDTALDPAERRGHHLRHRQHRGRASSTASTRRPTLGGKTAVIAMLDLFNNQVVSVDIDRDHGFLDGMGINPGNAKLNGAGGQDRQLHRAAASTRSPATSRPGRDRRRAHGDGELPVREPEHQRGLRDQRAGRRGRVQRRSRPRASRARSCCLAIDGSCAGLKLVTSGEFTVGRARSTRARWPRWASTRSPSWPAAAASRA